MDLYLTLNTEDYNILYLFGIQAESSQRLLAESHMHVMGGHIMNHGSAPHELFLKKGVHHQFSSCWEDLKNTSIKKKYDL